MIGLNSFEISAQCAGFITTFPYSESFESNSSWTDGGTSSDWSWGTPSHPTISSASSGTKCWCVGGLTGSAYNANQESFLMSPCFDFTLLDNPWISFDVFWETEYEWDGATFQYSLDEGNSWINVGAFGDAVDCLNDNWFNYNDVNWLTSANPKHGWSGRVGASSGSCTGGFGSGQWLEAKHCLNELANEPSIRFRFLFGSGNSCNNYDGFAIDNLNIQNAPANTVDFSYTCLPDNEISFTNLSDNCVTGYQWDFDDPNSGTSNTSSDENPIHLFSSGGNFNVSLSTTGFCNQITTFTKSITVLSPLVDVTDVSCFGENNGSASANGLVSSSYSWNTTPVQTSAAITNLQSGVYTVDIVDPNACPLSISVTISEPAELILNVNATPTCENSCTGSVSATATGGTPPYTYSWSSITGGQNINGIVCEGNYTGLVSDANSCSTSSSIDVTKISLPTITCDPANICIGSSATLTAFGAENYTWFPPDGLSSTNGSSVTANPPQTTEYTLTGVSSEGCTNTATVLVSVSQVFAPQANFTYSPDVPDIYNNEVIFNNLSQQANSYQWNFYNDYLTGEFSPTYTFPNETSGTYNVCLTAMNNEDCNNQICKLIAINGIPSVYVPNAFSPNGDLNNNYFYPVIRDINIESYTFSIYNRWGERIFTTKDVLEKWDGKYKGQECQLGIYTWKIIYKEEENTEDEIKIDGSFLLFR